VQNYDLILDHLSYISRLNGASHYSILMGLAVCEEAGDSLTIRGDAFYNRILKTTFQGMTGPVVLNQTTGTRLSNTTSYSILNYVELEVDIDGEKMIRFKPVLTYYYSLDSYGKNSSFGSGWEKIANFTFNHGTANLPPSLPAAPEHTMYINNGIQAFSFVLYATLLLMTLGCVAWTWYNHDDRVVKASQPFFLYLLCGGVALVGKSLSWGA
jgi:hypothetical protein